MSQVFKESNIAEQKHWKEIYRASGILDKWHDKTWYDFVNDERAKEIIQKYNVEKALKNGVGYYLFGSNGVGKTLLLNLKFQDLLHSGKKVKIISFSGLITKFTAGWYDPNERKSLMYDLQKVDFLGIEEIGKEFKPGSNDLGLMVLDTVLRYRVQMKKPTWLTSNIRSSQIEDIYGENITSMLRECCVDIQVKGEDYRKTIAEKIKKDFK